MVNVDERERVGERERERERERENLTIYTYILTDMEYTGVTNTSSGLLSASNSPSYGSPSNCSNFMTICAHNRTSVHSSCDVRRYTECLLPLSLSLSLSLFL